MAKNVKKKKKVVVEATGQAHIHSSFNNIIISLTNNNGQVISWSSAGKMGFRGSKKNTPYAAQVAAEDCGREAHISGCVKSEHLLKVQERAARAPCAPCTTWESKSSRSSMLRHSRTTDAAHQSVVASNSHRRT